jgi:hypothetical protein
VVDHRDLKKAVVRVLAGEQLLGEVGEEGDVVDDGLGDAPPGVADDGRVAEPESKGDRGVDAVVEAGDDNRLCCGRGERPGVVGSGELLVTWSRGVILVMVVPFLPRGRVIG